MNPRPPRPMARGGGKRISSTLCSAEKKRRLALSVREKKLFRRVPSTYARIQRFFDASKKVDGICCRGHERRRKKPATTGVRKKKKGSNHTSKETRSVSAIHAGKEKKGKRLHPPRAREKKSALRAEEKGSAQVPPEKDFGEPHPQKRRKKKRGAKCSILCLPAECEERRGYLKSNR